MINTNPASTTIIRGTGGAAAPGSPSLSGVIAKVTNVNLNSGAAQSLYPVPAGKTLIVDEVVLRAPTISAALIDGSLGLVSGGCTNWGAFPVQANLDGPTKVTHLYPSATGDSPVIAAGAAFGIILTTLTGVAGTMTVEVIGRLV